MIKIHYNLHPGYQHSAETPEKVQFFSKVKKLLIPALFGAIIGSLSTNLYLYIAKETFVTHIVLTVSVGIALGSLFGVLIVKVIDGRFKIKDFFSIIIVIIFSIISSKIMFDLFGQS